MMLKSTTRMAIPKAIAMTTGTSLLSIESISCGDPIRPGAVLQMEGRVDSMGPEIAVLSGRVTVDGTTVLAADGIMCALMPAEELENAAAVQRMRSAGIGVWYWLISSGLSAT